LTRRRWKEPKALFATDLLDELAQHHQSAIIMRQKEELPTGKSLGGYQE
jgi:hypothetical protein